MFTINSIITTSLFLLTLLPLNAQPSQFCQSTNVANITTATAAPSPIRSITPSLLTCPVADIATTLTIPTFKICLRPASEQDLISITIKDLGIWEPINTARIVNLFLLQKSTAAPGAGGSEKQVVIDIGAHLGWYTLLAASHGFSVVAFEPIRAQRERLEASVLLNGFETLVTIMPYAVSNKFGFSTMWTSLDFQVVIESGQKTHTNSNSGGSWIRPKGWTTEEASEYAQVSEIGVETVLLDHTLNALNLLNDDDDKNEIFLIKIDIEGHLGLALSGGQQTIKHATFLFLEITPKIEAVNGCNVTIIMNYLYHQGFRMCYSSRPKCDGNEDECNVDQRINDEKEACLDQLPNERRRDDDNDDGRGEGEEWMYEDVLLAKIAAPSQ